MPTKTREAKTKTERKVTHKSKLYSVEKLQTLPQLSNLKFNRQALLKNRKTPLFLVLIIILAIALLYVFRGVFVAALVNGEPIPRLSVVRALEKQNGKATLDNLITKKLILQEARKRNVVITDAEISSELKKIETNLKSQGTSLDQALELQGMTRNGLNDEIRIQLALQKTVGDNIKISDKEIKKFITENKENFPPNTTDAQMKSQAKEQLKSQKLQDKTQAFIANLQKKAKVLNFVKY